MNDFNLNSPRGGPSWRGKGSAGGEFGQPLAGAPPILPFGPDPERKRDSENHPDKDYIRDHFRHKCLARDFARETYFCNAQHFSISI